MATKDPLFTVGPPPHWRLRVSVAQMNYAFILALVPAAVVGCIAYGFGPSAITEVGPARDILTRLLRILVRELGVPAGVLNLAAAFGLLFLSAGTALLVEYITQVLFRQPYHAVNGHGILMGLILGMMMPPTVPWWVVVIGVTVAIVLGKQIYGGMGGYPFHPAMVGWLILMLSWPHHIYPVGMKSIACMHWVAIYVTLVFGIGLIALGHLRWPIPAAVIIGVLLAGALFHWVYPENGPAAWWEDAAHEVLTGHVILAAFFIAPDTTSSPVNALPRWLYGLIAGAMIMIIRTYGVWPDAVPFAVLLANLLSPMLERMRPRPKEVVIQHG